MRGVGGGGGGRSLLLSFFSLFFPVIGYVGGWVGEGSGMDFLGGGGGGGLEDASKQAAERSSVCSSHTTLGAGAYRALPCLSHGCRRE